MTGDFSLEPIFINGTVVRGYGRGSTQIGFPTANLDAKAVSSIQKDIRHGVYAGIASVEGYDGVYKAAVSIGNNPHFKNDSVSVECYILNKFTPEHFYGSQLKLVIIEFLREMVSYSSLEELIEAIGNDIKMIEDLISEKLIILYSKHDFFS